MSICRYLDRPAETVEKPGKKTSRIASWFTGGRRSSPEAFANTVGFDITKTSRVVIPGVALSRGAHDQQGYKRQQRAKKYQEVVHQGLYVLKT